MSVMKPADPSLDAGLSEAKAAKLNPFRTGDRLLDQEREEKARRCQAEHTDVIDWYNEHIERDGIFGDEWRAF